MKEPASRDAMGPGLPGLRRVDTRDHRLFIVTLPEPERATEAWMACLAYEVHRGFFSTKPGARRYFTLERGADPRTKATLRFFCEWEGARERHVNRGKVEAVTVEAFAGLVRATLAEE